MTDQHIPSARFFESKRAVADFLKIDYVEFLKMVSDGRFPVRSKPKDATPIWMLSDLEVWQKRVAMLRGEE